MYKLSRRHVLATLSSSAVMLCPAILNAQALDLGWDDIPTTEPIGQSSLMMIEEGPADIDLSELAPGEVAVIARPTTDDAYSATGMTQYIGVLHRTEAQIAYGADNDRDGVIQVAAYLVVNLVCPHRGKAIGISGDPDRPFACTDRGARHSSEFDASGMGVDGASDGDPMSIPEYSIDGTTLSLA